MSRLINKTDPKCREAIRLKFMNEQYASIAKKIKVSLSTVEHWFASDGFLKEEYDNYSREKTNELGLLCDENLAKNVLIASNMLVALMGSTEDGVKFRAVKEILDRVRGTPKSNNSDPQGLAGTDLSYEEILRKARAQPP